MSKLIGPGQEDEERDDWNDEPDYGDYQLSVPKGFNGKWIHWCQYIDCTEILKDRKGRVTIFADKVNCPSCLHHYEDQIIPYLYFVHTQFEYEFDKKINGNDWE